MLLQKCYCLLTGDAVIEFDAEYAFFKFAVMNNSDVLNAECIRSRMVAMVAITPASSGMSQ